MTIFLPEKKKEEIISPYETLLIAGQASIWEIVSVLEMLTST